MIKYKFEPDIVEFLKNKKANIKKLVDASNEKNGSYVFDQNYMYKVDHRVCMITAWFMGMEENFEVWRIGYSPNWL